MVQAPVFVTPNGAVTVLCVPKDGNLSHRDLTLPAIYAKPAMLEKCAKIVPRDILARIVQCVLLDGGHGQIHLYYSMNPFLPTTIVIFATSVHLTILVTIVHDVPMATTYHKQHSSKTTN